MVAPQDLVTLVDNDAPDAPVRHKFVGASEAAELLGELHYRKGCPRWLAYKKLRIAPDIRPDQTTQRAISMRATLARGHYLEDLGAQLYTRETGRKTRHNHKLLLHPNHPGAGCHPDRLIIASDSRGSGDLEIKSHAQGPFLRILREGLPISHMLQLQWTLWCTGHRFGSFAVIGVFSELPFRHFDLEPDLAWHEIFARAVDNFWDTLDHGELPPQLPDPADSRCKVCPYRLTCRGTSLDLAEYYQLLEDQKLEDKQLKRISNRDLSEALADRALIKGELSELDKVDDEEPGALQLVNARIKELVGDERRLLVDNEWVVYCEDGKWTGLDIARLRQEEPELFDKYYIVGRPTHKKTLRVYAARKEHSNGR